MRKLAEALILATIAIAFLLLLVSLAPWARVAARILLERALLGLI